MKQLEVRKQNQGPLLPDGAYVVEDEQIQLRWPEGVKQRFLCPKCGVIDTVDVQTTQPCDKEVYYVFQFVPGQGYVKKGTYNGGSMREAGALKLEAFCCAKCGDDILYEGQDVSTIKGAIGDSTKNVEKSGG